MKRYLVFAGPESCRDGQCGWDAFWRSYDTLVEIETDRVKTRAFVDQNPGVAQSYDPSGWAAMDWYQVVDTTTEEMITWNQTNQALLDTTGSLVKHKLGR